MKYRLTTHNSFKLEIFCSEITEVQAKKICSNFLTALTEYTQDNRGDIGAWVREAAMSGLQTLTLILAKHKPDYFGEEMAAKVLPGIAQQAVEKIDRTRALAGRIFYGLIHAEPKVPNVPDHEDLLRIFPKEDCEFLNWNSAAVTFPLFVRLLKFDAYTYSVLLGLVCSVGGMTETLVKSSSSSLFGFLKRGEMEIAGLCETTKAIFSDYQKNDRVTVPMFRFLDKLFSSGCIEKVIEDQSNDWTKRILKMVQVELNGCKDLYKLIDGINILCQFLQVGFSRRLS